MKNKFGRIIIKLLITIAVIAIGVFASVLYSNAKGEEKKDKSQKIEKEIDYLDTKLTSIINSLNGIQLENYKISVNKVQEEEEESNSGESQEESGEKSGKEEEEQGTSNSSKEVKITKAEQELTEVGKEINWEKIQGDAEVFYSVWATIILDLYDIDIDSRKNCRI